MMVGKALSLITLVVLRVLVTLSSAMVSSVELLIKRVAPSSLKGTPLMNQEIVGEEETHDYVHSLLRFPCIQ